MTDQCTGRAVASLPPALLGIFRTCGDPTRKNLRSLVAEIPAAQRGGLTIGAAVAVLHHLVRRQADLQHERADQRGALPFWPDEADSDLAEVEGFDAIGCMASTAADHSPPRKIRKPAPFAEPMDGRQFDAEIRELGFTQTSFGEWVGVTARTIRQYVEKGAPAHMVAVVKLLKRNRLLEAERQLRLEDKHTST